MLYFNFNIGRRGGARGRFPLDGKPYVLDLFWLAAEQVWTLAIRDATAEIIVNIPALRHGEDVIEGLTDPRLPPGRLRVWDTSGAQADPGRLDLRRGAPVRLIYITAAEKTG